MTKHKLTAVFILVQPSNLTTNGHSGYNPSVNYYAAKPILRRPQLLFYQVLMAFLRLRLACFLGCAARPSPIYIYTHFVCSKRRNSEPSIVHPSVPYVMPTVLAVARATILRREEGKIRSAIITQHLHNPQVPLSWFMRYLSVHLRRECVRVRTCGRWSFTSPTLNAICNTSSYNRNQQHTYVHTTYICMYFKNLRLLSHSLHIFLDPPAVK